MSPLYLPIYGIYLPSLTKTFMYHLKNLQISFPFVPVQAHAAVGVINIFHAKDVLLVDKVLTSQIYEAEARL